MLPMTALEPPAPLVPPADPWKDSSMDRPLTRPSVHPDGTGLYHWYSWREDGISADLSEAWFFALLPTMRATVQNYLGGRSRDEVEDAIDAMTEKLLIRCRALPPQDDNIPGYIMQMIAWRSLDTLRRTRNGDRLFQPLNHEADGAAEYTHDDGFIVGQRAACYALMDTVPSSVLFQDMINAIPAHSQLRTIAIMLSRGYRPKEIAQSLDITLSMLRRRIHNHIKPALKRYLQSVKD